MPAVANHIRRGVDKVRCVWVHEAGEKVEYNGEINNALGLQLYTGSKDNGLHISNLCIGHFGVELFKKGSYSRERWPTLSFNANKPYF